MNPPKRLFNMLVTIIQLFLISYAEGQKHFGVQSDDGDLASSFGSSLVVDRRKSRIYITGATTGSFFQPGSTSAIKEKSDCFMAILQLPLRREETEPVWLRRVTTGQRGATEACSSIHATKSGGADPRIYLTGYSDGRQEQNDTATTVGMVFDMTWYGKLQGGYLINERSIQYPQVIQSSPDMDDIFVASLFSNATSPDSPKLDEKGMELDNTMAGSYQLPENRFAVLLQRVSPFQANSSNAVIETLNMTSSVKIHDGYFSHAWTREMHSPKGSLTVSDMLLLTDRSLAVAGSLKTQEQMSDATASPIVLQKPFLSVIDSLTGETAKDIGIPSGLLSRDQVFGLCRHEGNDTSDFYAVGVTNGDLYTLSTSRPAVSPRTSSSQAFLLKINQENSEISWTYQLGALAVGGEETSHIHGLGCSVTPDGSRVYMAGTVKSGSAISVDGIESESVLGGDDMFIAQIRSDDGILVFARQLGTEQHDRLAAGRGIACDEQGNAILLGNTLGSFFRDKQVIGEGFANDVVVFSVDRETGHVGKAVTADETPLPDNINTTLGDEIIPDVDTTNEQQPEAPRSSEQQDDRQVAYIVSLVLLGNIALLSALCLRYSRRHYGGRLAKDVQKSVVQAGEDTSTGSHTGSDEPHDPLLFSSTSSGSSILRVSDDSSGTTLRKLPSLGQFDENRDTLLQLELDPLSNPIKEEDKDDDDDDSDDGDEEDSNSMYYSEREEWNDDDKDDDDSVANEGTNSLWSDLSRHFGTTSLRNKYSL